MGEPRWKASSILGMVRSALVRRGSPTRDEFRRERDMIARARRSRDMRSARILGKDAACRSLGETRAAIRLDAARVNGGNAHRPRMSPRRATIPQREPPFVHG